MAQTIFTMIAAFVFLTTSISFSAESGNMPKQYIGIVPFYSPDKIWQLYTPLINYLNKSTNVKWELKLYSDHNSIIEDVCSGAVTITLFGPVPFSRAYDKCKIKPLLVALGKDGSTFYRSIIVTADQGVNSLKDLKGKKFAMFKGSTASHVLPIKLLEDEGISLNNIKPVYLGSQDRIVNAVLLNEAAAAGIKESLFEKLKEFKLKILKTSEPLHNFAFCATPGINAQVEREFTSALLKLKPFSSADDKSKVTGWDDEIKNGFIAPPKNYIDDAMKLLKLFKKYSD